MGKAQRKASIGVLALMFFLLWGCEKKQPEDEYKFIEYIEVKGVCSEDHVKQTAEYEGSIVHWHNVTKNEHSRYGHVCKVGLFSPEELIAAVEEPHKYRPPSFIAFWDLTPGQVSNKKFTLRGFSDDDGKPHYEASCDLKVVQRLDYLPSAKDTK